MSFRRHTYPEVLESLLTSLTDGVAAEPHPFPPDLEGSPLRHALLEPPVAEVISVYGSRGGEPHLFRQGADADYVLAADERTLEWRPSAELPDPGTVIQVNYYPRAARPVVTDIHSGSVVRTLCETFALEVAGLYGQLQAVYEAGFVDTATGGALDKVVALLGVERLGAGFAAGEVEFVRARGSRGAVFVPAGTRVMSEDGDVEYETTAAVTLAEGQSAVRVLARDLELNEPLAAGALSVLTQPLAGIGAVTNPAPTTIQTRPESDAELRQRARRFLAGSARATPGALIEAASRQGVRVDLLEAPGRVEVLPHADALTPEQHERMLAAIEEVRPAGVVVALAPARAPRRVDLALLVTTVEGLAEADLRAAHLAVRATVEDFFARLPADRDASFTRLAGEVLQNPQVEDLRLLEASWRVDGTVEPLELVDGALPVAGGATELGELALSDPALATLLEAVVTFPSTEEAPDATLLEAALAAAIAHFNQVNATPVDPDADGPTAAREIERRSVSFGKLLHLLPLPGRAAGVPADLDAEPLPPLPGTADAAPFAVTFALSQAGGLSRTLAADGEEVTLQPFERLDLAGVEVREVE